jgi:transposase
MISDKTVRTDAHLYEELKRQKKEIARLIEERDLLKRQPRNVGQQKDGTRLTVLNDPVR